jgi:hypothetical protein
MIRQLALVTIFASILLIGAAYALAFLPGGAAPPLSSWLMVFGIAALMVATMALGAVRNGRLSRLWVPLALVFLILIAGFGGALLLPRADLTTEAFWLGLPPGAAIVIYGVGLLPLFVVPLAYAHTFEESTLGAADLERLQRAVRERALAQVSAEGELAISGGSGERAGALDGPLPDIPTGPEPR